MSSHMIGLGRVVALATVLAGTLAAAQDRKLSEPAGGGKVAVFNAVEGRVVVVSAKQGGSRVESGDTVCEFDSAELRDRQTSQELVVSGAQSEVHGTRIAREVAVMALAEYKEGVFRQQFASIEGQINMVESKLASAEDHVDWSRRMFQKGYASLAEKVAAELSLKQARFALEDAQSQKKVLIDYSKARTIKALTGAIESARSRELAAQSVLERERSVQRRLADQIARCSVKAPVSGRIEYAAPFGAGAVVHDGQLIFHVFTDAAAKVKSE
jgi:HlyD family secretion protein